MPGGVSLEEAERLVAQLPPAERLKLVAHVCEQLSAEAGEHRQAADLEAWLADCDALRLRLRGSVDAVQELKKLRQERAGQP